MRVRDEGTRCVAVWVGNSLVNPLQWEVFVCMQGHASRSITKEPLRYGAVESVSVFAELSCAGGVCVCVCVFV